MSSSRAANRLAREPSLYLQQHGHNPVDWYPWSDEALARSRAEDRPILLSIGYSACHWCHVMERESFENEAIARLMNELFVPIKVDREERPDLDNIYMKAVQIMTGRGGWPMTVFLTPELEPFYAGTYFPPEDRGGMPGFPRVLMGVAQAWRDQTARVRESAIEITQRIESLSSSVSADPAPAGPPAIEDLVAAADTLAGVMDADHGGFGSEPKFPGTLCLSFLIGMERAAPDPHRRALVTTALDRMADGGIYDHLGGGFHRYSVDRYWLVPHFEKMLYDQALLAEIYTEAWLAFREPRYREVVLGVLDYVATGLSAPEGGFHSTLDADSEGVEGKYFVWTPDEVREVVEPEDAELVCRFYEVTDGGNFEGSSILHRTLTISQAAKLFERDEAGVVTTIEKARAALLARRAQRVPPATDTKMLTDWNGLMIGAMARAGRLFERPDLVDRAAAAADFLSAAAERAGRLQHFQVGGEARVDAFLDDHAFLGRGLLELYLAAGREADLRAARRSADVLIDRFEDTANGGFFFTTGDDASVLVRERDLHDSAVPSGNAVAAELMLRLHALTGEGKYERAGRAVIETFATAAVRNPHGGALLLTIVERMQRGYATVVVAGRAEGDDLERAALDVHAPELSILSTAAGRPDAELPDVARGKPAPASGQAAYVCRGSTCSAPISDPSRLIDELRAG